MKVLIALAFLCVAVGASAQQSRDVGGEISGIVVGQDGKPVKNMRLSAVMKCSSGCGLWMSETVTNEAGEYRFQHVPLGEKYSVFSDNTKEGYPRFGPAAAGVVEVTAGQPLAKLRVKLPPKPGILMIHLTDRTTGATIPRVLVKLKVLDAPDSKWSEQWADSSNCLFFPDCAVPVVPDKPLLVHVSAWGFNEWDQSIGEGKPLLVHSGAQTAWNIQLNPLSH